MKERGQSVTVTRYIKVLFKRVQEDGAFDLAAQLAFYFLLSLFPFLIFTFALLSFINVNSENMLDIVARFAPMETLHMIEKNLRNVFAEKHGGLLSFGIIATIWSASNAIHAIMRALNRAYNVEENRPFFTAKGIAILLTFAMIVVIVVALVLPVFGELIGRFIFSQFGLEASFLTIWGWVRWILSFLIIVTVFAILYCAAPNQKLHCHEVVFGAVVATLGWQLASLGFSYYVSNFNNYTAMYGSLGGIIVLMLWFYLTAFIMVLGGEINAVNRYFEKG